MKYKEAGCFGTLATRERQDAIDHSKTIKYGQRGVMNETGFTSVEQQSTSYKPHGRTPSRVVSPLLAMYCKDKGLDYAFVDRTLKKYE